MSGVDSPMINGSPIGVDPSAPQDAGRKAVGEITLERFLRPLGIAGMLTCIAISVSQLISEIAPTWPGRFFSLATFLIALESVYSHRLLNARKTGSRDTMRFRFIEWVVILLFLRLGVYAFYGIARLIQDFAIWSLDIGRFFDGTFVVMSLLSVVMWALALQLARCIQDLEAAPLEKPLSVMDPDFYLRSTMPGHGLTDRQARLNSILTIFFGGGIVLLLLAGFARVDVRDLLVFQHSPSSGVVLNVMVYFVIGLLLISDAQYHILKANWDLQGIPVFSGIARRWLLFVLALLAGLALVSALLPVSYSVGFIDTLSTVIQWLMFYIAQIVFFFLYLIGQFLGLLMSLLSGKTSDAPSEGFQSPIAPPETPLSVVGGPSPWWQIVRSLLFWAVLTGLIGYSLYHFVGERWGLLNYLPFKRLVAWLQGFRQRMRARARRLAVAVRKRLERRTWASASQGRLSPWRYLALRALPPRERIRFFYLLLLHRSAELGLGRAPASTPIEYAQLLDKELLQEAEQVAGLTQAFVEARYSEHPLDAGDANRALVWWRQLRRALALRKRDRARPAQDAPSTEKRAGEKL
jgi:hypothetical protein